MCFITYKKVPKASDFGTFYYLKNLITGDVIIPVGFTI